MWAFTGGCHYNGNCFNFNTGCENCHMLNAVTKRDLSFYNAKRKRSLYAKNKISFIAPSTWMLQEGLRSALLKNQRIVHIPNAFNAKKYPLLNRKECREKLNLSINKSLVIFGAINPEDDPRKGYKHVKNCLTYLKDDSKIKFAIFGSETSRSNEFKNFGFIESELKMREILSAADCVIVPSEQENLSNLIIESMSCGTPVVAFDIGGNDNIINHKSNGYLAKPFDSKDLASGIKFILKTKIDQSVCRKKIEKDFNYERIAKMHSEFYNELVS